MSLKNEIFEGIAAYKALTPTAQDKYQGEMYKIAKRENDDYEEKIRNRGIETAEAEARKAAAVPPLQASIPTQSRSDMIGSGMTDQAGNPVYNTALHRRGGRVRRFADGGFLGGVASGIKSTFQAPRALNVWSTRPQERDAGLRGSDDIAQDAAQRYGSVEVPPEHNRGGRVRGRKAIRTNYRAGGAVRPEEPPLSPSPRLERMPRREAPQPYTESDSARPRSMPPNVVREPYNPDETWPEGWEGTPEDEEDFDYGTPRHPHYFAVGGTVEQGDNEDDRVQPTEEDRQRNRQLMEDIRSGRRQVPRYGTEDFRRRSVGPQSDQDFEPRRPRAKAFDDGGLAGAFRGGRPEYNPEEDPDVIEKNRADAIIREIISSQIGEPNAANDPSLELSERGAADRARVRAAYPPPPQHDDPSAQITQRNAAAREARRRKSDDIPPYEGVPGVNPPAPSVPRPAPDRVGPTPAAATRAELEAKYRALIPEPPEHPDPEMELRRDTDDAYLSTDSAVQPPGADTDDAYLSTGSAREAPDAERDYRRQFPRPPQDQPISEEETQAIKLGTPVPKTSRYRDWAQRGVDEDAANARANQEDWRKRERERKQTRGKASAERQEAEPGLFENLTPQELQARREREAAAARIASSTEPPNIVYPQREEELRALEPKVPPPPATQPTENLPVKRDGTPPPGEQYGPPPPTAAQAAGKPTAIPPRPPGAGDPSVYGPVIQRPADDPDYLGATPVMGYQVGEGPVYGPPAPADPRAPPARTPVDEPYGPPAPGSVSAPAPAPAPAPATRIGGGGGRGTDTAGGAPDAPAPPPGAASANRPSTAEKPETRTAAYDPTVDRVDPSTGVTMPRQLDAQGRAIATGPPPIAQGDGGPPGSPATGQITRTSSTQTYGDVNTQPGSLGSSTGFSNTDIAQTLNGAATLVRPGVNGGPPPIGHLAASRPYLNAYVKHNNQGGTLTPGEAMLVGMVSDYKTLLKQGRIKQANEMAYGLLQAANLEAASHGKVARDKAMSGDWKGAKQEMVNGLNYIADGVSQRLSADGHYMESYDPRTGEVTARTPLDGQTILAGIMGLSDGTLFWKTLQLSAAHLQKPDTGAEGRQLSNELRRRQIALADKRLNAPTGRARTGATTSGGMSSFQRDLARIRGEKPEHTGGGGGGGGGDGSDDDLALINLDVRDQD